jgi:hypothetical protein
MYKLLMIFGLLFLTSCVSSKQVGYITFTENDSLIILIDDSTLLKKCPMRDINCITPSDVKGITILKSLGSRGMIVIKTKK